MVVLCGVAVRRIILRIDDDHEMGFFSFRRKRPAPFADGVTPLLSSIPEELSFRLFSSITPHMSGLGAVMSGGE